MKRLWLVLVMFLFACPSLRSNPNAGNGHFLVSEYSGLQATIDAASSAGHNNVVLVDTLVMVQPDETFEIHSGHGITIRGLGSYHPFKEYDEANPRPEGTTGIHCATPCEHTIFHVFDSGRVVFEDLSIRIKSFQNSDSEAIAIHCEESARLDLFRMHVSTRGSHSKGVVLDGCLGGAIIHSEIAGFRKGVQYLRRNNQTKSNAWSISASSRVHSGYYGVVIEQYGARSLSITDSTIEGNNVGVISYSPESSIKVSGSHFENRYGGADGGIAGVWLTAGGTLNSFSNQYSKSPALILIDAGVDAAEVVSIGDAFSNSGGGLPTKIVNNGNGGFRVLNSGSTDGPGGPWPPFEGAVDFVDFHNMIFMR